MRVSMAYTKIMAWTDGGCAKDGENVDADDRTLTKTQKTYSDHQ